VECHPLHAQSASIGLLTYRALSVVADDAEREEELLWLPLLLALDFAALVEPGAFLIRTEDVICSSGFCLMCC